MPNNTTHFDGINRVLMLSAMFENGGNHTHRLLDGHPYLAVYPFESQFGTRFSIDFLSSLVPERYRYPIIPLSFTLDEIFTAIIDEELKVRVNTPRVSKFCHFDFKLSEKKRKKAFIEQLRHVTVLTRRDIILAYFRATFNTWENYVSSGLEDVFVGFSPLFILDTEKFFCDFGKKGYLIHVVRNPFSAYASTLHRPTPLSIMSYMDMWNLCQQRAIFNNKKYKDRFFIVRFEDIISDPNRTLQPIIRKIGLPSRDIATMPQWNGNELPAQHPFGVIHNVTEKSEKKLSQHLTRKQVCEIADRGQLLRSFSYGIPK